MRIEVLFAGDFCTEHPDRIVVGNSLRQLLNKANVCLLNFEGPLESSTPNHPNSHVLRQSNRSPQWCVDNKFDLFSLANNHIWDYGEEGINNTKRAFPEDTTLGVGLWNEAYSVKIITIDNVRIGFSAVSSADLSSLKDEWTDSEKSGSAWINHPQYDCIIQDAKSKCDYLFVFAHAGVEYMPYPLPEWRDRYRSLIDLGADGVIATHPHVPQSFELYKGKPIIYSLGNFYFDWFHDTPKPNYWDDSLIASLNLEDGKVTCHVIPVSRKGDTIDIDNSMKSHDYLESISLNISDTSYIEKVNQWVLKLFPKYYSWLLSGIGTEYYPKKSIKALIRRVFRSIIPLQVNYRISLHQLREESTRYLITRAMRLMSNTQL